MPVLETFKLRKDFSALTAVHDVSFSVEAGQVVGLVGPNGAGKTTLLRMIATLLRPTSGSVRIMGLDIRHDHIAARKVIGYLPDFFNLYNDLRIWEVLTFFAEAYGVPQHEIAGRVERTLDQVKLTHKRDDFVKHLSRGMVQRMGMAARLVHDPTLFLLDEPASGLDPKARIDLRDILRGLCNEGKTVIVSSHILTELADFCTHVGIMNQGKMVEYGAVGDMGEKGDGSRRFRLRILGDLPHAGKQLQSLRPAASISHLGEQELLIESDGSLEDWADLLQSALEAGIRVVDFHEQGSAIEDAFMKVAQEES